MINRGELKILPYARDRLSQLFVKFKEDSLVVKAVVTG